MRLKIFFCITILLLNFSCSKKEDVAVIYSEEQSYEVYKEAMSSLERGDFFVASKKFAEAETILPEIDHASKALLMSSYCLYSINFYEQATESLERFVAKYPADNNITYAKYLLTIISQEKILDEKKDITPLLESKSKIIKYLDTYPDTEYSVDLRYKMDLINNQLAAKELYIAKFYIETKKWIPAINRLKNIVENFSETIFIEEALHRLVEVYYKVGLVNEANSTAVLLGYNYNSSEWYQKSYKILNKNYKIPKIKKAKKNTGLIKKTIKKIMMKN